ncbi:MAG: galactokinase [Spirochaetaceae bacterium]
MIAFPLMDTEESFHGRIRAGHHDGDIEAVYPGDLEEQRARLAELCERFVEEYADQPQQVFSAPGRTELGGNHTDHNAGRVLAAGVTLDTVAAVSPRTDARVRIVSEGFEGTIEVDTRELMPVKTEAGSPAALVRGVAAFLRAHGREVGGFDAVVTSRVAPGSGLSSSASFEVLIAVVFSFLHNDGTLTPVEIARAGRHAENEFFGKPAGLMDQIACAAGGVVTIDFEDEEAPTVQRITAGFADRGYRLFAVDSGAGHADLTDDYAAVVHEMKEAARVFGRSTLREVEERAFFERLPEVRSRVGDRAVLRALHYFRENRRVLRQARLLTDGDIEGFLSEVRESGSSSWRLLQNCYSPAALQQQGIPLALALSETFLEESTVFPRPPRLHGAARVHGGGFAGTIQAYVPTERATDYRRAMSAVFGEGSVTPLTIRPLGACLITGTPRIEKRSDRR